MTQLVAQTKKSVSVKVLRSCFHFFMSKKEKHHGPSVAGRGFRFGMGEGTPRVDICIVAREDAVTRLWILSGSWLSQSAGVGTPMDENVVDNVRHAWLPVLSDQGPSLTLIGLVSSIKKMGFWGSGFRSSIRGAAVGPCSSCSKLEKCLLYKK